MSPADVERINNQLRDNYGIDTVTGQQMWRVVFSDDQTEKRIMKHSDGGIELAFPEAREVKKYPWIRHKWGLEHLVLVPFHQQYELCGIKQSYEWMFTFDNSKGEPLPPKYEVCQYVINLIEVAKDNAQPNVAKYVEDPEAAKKELAELEEYLHGNETDVADHLMYGTGVAVPSNYESNKVH